MTTPGPGNWIGPYEVVSLLGAGGMGEVYLARDTKLDRQVAIKVLPAAMTRDQERVARFEREAKLLASINHPNIAAIHGFDDSDGTRFLVMEYVEGETLAQRLKSGAFPVEDALDVAKQMAEALEAAHEQGVVHRDLKPANVMIRPDGSVKVLDFGLAKPMAEDPSAPTPADSPTITADFTKPGVVLGTAAYMSPEQARGRPLDKRTDIWSFGVILYECLTGQLLFRGETATDSMGAIMHREPDWSALPSETPSTVRLLLRRCLHKDRKRRLHDIADARVELEEVIADPANSALDLIGSATQARNGSSRVSLILTPLALLLVAVFAASAAWQLKPQPEPTHPVLRKLEIHVNGADPYENLWPLISPDGTRIVYVAKGSLWVRSLDDRVAIELGGTEGAAVPFWSPDSSQVGFHSDRRLWRIPATGGARTMICVTPNQKFTNASGAAWTADDRVVFTSASGGPFREVPVGGGEPRTIVTPDPDRIRDFHGASALPDGSGVLSVAHQAKGEGKADAIVLVRDGSFETLLQHPGNELSSAVYASGHIVYGREQATGTIWAVPFSLESKKVTGASFLVADAAERPSVSSDGTLVYAASIIVSAGQLAWIDRTGAVTELIGKPQQGLSDPVVSPDNARVAAFAMETGAQQIWIHDLARGTRRPFAVDEGGVWIPGWVSEDRLAYNSGGKTYARSVIRSDPPELLVDDSTMTISDDLRYAAVERRTGESLNIYYFDLQNNSGALPLLVSEALEDNPVIRPGGGWLAYKSNETGRGEIYLVRFPSGEDKRQVSVEGGGTVYWSGQGDELFFQTDFMHDADIMVVGVTTEPELQLTEPKRLFGAADSPINIQKGWSVSSDGQRIMGVRAVAGESDTRRITVVENWYREFEKP